jgi:hypothetical protein
VPQVHQILHQVDHILIFAFIVVLSLLLAHSLHALNWIALGWTGEMPSWALGLASGFLQFITTWLAGGQGFTIGTQPVTGLASAACPGSSPSFQPSSEQLGWLRK